MEQITRTKLLSPEFATDLAGAERYAQACERTLRRKVASGDLPAYKVDGRLRFLFADLDALVERVQPKAS